MPDDPDRQPRRRGYERDIDPTTVTFVEHAVNESRHLLRNEFTAALLAATNKLSELATATTAAQLQATREHAEVNRRLDRLQTIAEILPNHERRILNLERHDDVDAAQASARDELLDRLDKNRRWMVTTAIALAAPLIATVVVVLAH